MRRRAPVHVGVDELHVGLITCRRSMISKIANHTVFAEMCRLLFSTH